MSGTLFSSLERCVTRFQVKKAKHHMTGPGSVVSSRHSLFPGSTLCHFSDGTPIDVTPFGRKRNKRIH